MTIFGPPLVRGIVVALISFIGFAATSRHTFPDEPLSDLPLVAIPAVLMGAFVVYLSSNNQVPTITGTEGA